MHGGVWYGKSLSIVHSGNWQCNTIPYVVCLFVVCRFYFFFSFLVFLSVLVRPIFRVRVILYKLERLNNCGDGSLMMNGKKMERGSRRVAGQIDGHQIAYWKEEEEERKKPIAFASDSLENWIENPNSHFSYGKWFREFSRLFSFIGCVMHYWILILHMNF